MGTRDSLFSPRSLVMSLMTWRSAEKRSSDLSRPSRRSRTWMTPLPEQTSKNTKLFALFIIIPFAETRMVLRLQFSPRISARWCTWVTLWEREPSGSTHSTPSRPPPPSAASRSRASAASSASTVWRTTPRSRRSPWLSPRRTAKLVLQSISSLLIQTGKTQ